jgi:hypothetical protein
MMKNDRARHSGLTERPNLNELNVMSTRDEFEVEVIFSASPESDELTLLVKWLSKTSALSTFEEPVYAVRNDRICLDLRQVLADEVA